jgi:chemotaxis-related protein WspB
MMRRDPAEFRPAGVDTAGARYLGPVVTDARGLIQRVEVAALLDDAVRAVLFSAADAAAAP